MLGFMLNPVATTGLLVAAIRAEETRRADRLFDDPFAARLAGDAGAAALESYRGSAGMGGVPIIEVRTKFFDEALLRAAESGVRQFVILAAGMDARSYRLPWPAGTRVFEVDQPDVVRFKSETLANERPRCERRAIGADLAGDWSNPLVAAGFDSSARTAWLVEGLLQYIPRSAVEALFDAIEAHSAPRSVAAYDVVGQSLLDAPFMAGMLSTMRELGAPWVFGTDEPGALLERHRWTARVIDPAAVGNTWGRWPVPPVPLDVPGVPRGYFIEAEKLTRST
jgi:methyltransferase (TIGR00027 family)